VRPPIEPGVLALFRLFVGLEILLLVLRMALEAAFRADFPLVGSPWTGLLWLTLSFAYLSWPGLGARLGALYLPLGVLLSAAVTLGSASAVMRARLEVGIRAEELVRGSWLVIVLLVVPLVVVAWQYGFRWVLEFCALTTAADLALTLPFAAGNRPLALTLVVIAFARGSFFVPVGYAVARLVDTHRRQRQALVEAHARLARHAVTLEQLAVSRERNRLAYELHDTLAHGLSSLAVQLEAISTLWHSQPTAARTMLADALATTRTALREARRAIAALRASPVEDLGLATAVRELARSTAARAGLQLDLHVPDGLERLTPEAEHALHRVAAEALANAVRHAEARRLTVRLEDAGGSVNLLVADDGRGFDPATAPAGGRFGARRHAGARPDDRGRARGRGRPGDGNGRAAHPEEGQ
jgi:signal transduction histidine kinase